MRTDLQPTRAKIRITRGSVARGNHRSTLFAMTFDISNLINPDGTAVVEGEELEEILTWWCTNIIKDNLAQARREIPNHP